MTITVSVQTAREFAEYALIESEAFLDIDSQGGTSARGGQSGRLEIGKRLLFDWEYRTIYLFFNGKTLHSLTEDDFERLAQHLTEGANKVYAMRYGR